MAEKIPNQDDQASLWALRVAAGLCTMAAVVPVYNTIQHGVHAASTPAVAEATGKLTESQQDKLDQWVSDEQNARNTAGIEAAAFLGGAMYFGLTARREKRKIAAAKGVLKPVAKRSAPIKAEA